MSPTGSCQDQHRGKQNAPVAAGVGGGSKSVHGVQGLTSCFFQTRLTSLFVYGQKTEVHVCGEATFDSEL